MFAAVGCLNNMYTKTSFPPKIPSILPDFFMRFRNELSTMSLVGSLL
jgi:hypothetical protein